MTAMAGLEWRQTQAGSSSIPGLRFSLSGSYSITPRTVLSINLQRGENPSISDAGQNYIQTGAGLTLSQQIGRRSTVMVGASYDEAAFGAAQKDVTTDRSDQFYSMHAAYAYQVSSRVTVSFFHTYRRQDSTSERFYRNHITGLSTLFQF